MNGWSENFYQGGLNREGFAISHLRSEYIHPLLEDNSTSLRSFATYFLTFIPRLNSVIIYQFVCKPDYDKSTNYSLNSRITRTNKK